MKKIRINANAKINLFLEVGARRADGYHDIESVMQSVTLCDTVTVCAGEEVPEGIRLECGGLYTDERNIAYRAAALFFAESGSEPRADIVIEKRIPIAAGLAGGSTDGAAVLYALNAIYDGVLDGKKLHALAARLGADVPFCLDGGTALAQIAQHYLGKAGLLVLAATVTLACLKTAVGLITSCAETFVGMFPKGLSYRNWVFVFTGISFLLANVGLTAIITYAVPVLMFLYPLAITLILLALLGHFFDHDRAVYAWVTGLTLVAAFYDLLRTLPDHLRAVLHVNGLVDTVGKALPFATIGLGWICPAILGLVIGLIFRAVRPKKA